MLSRIQRLKKEKDILFVLKKGVQLKGRYFRIRASKPPHEADGGKMAVVVSSKEFKLAVQRNAVRRRTFAAFEKFMPALKEWQLIVFPSVQLTKEKYLDLVIEAKQHVYTLTHNTATDHRVSTVRVPGS